MRRLLGNLGLSILATLVALGIAEAGLRFWNEIPVLRFDNFVSLRLERSVETETAAYDEKLGWRAKRDLRLVAPYTTTTDEHGFRMHGTQVREVPQQGVVAVGDSFTWGSEVSDHETWPAQLEAMIDLPVVNAAYGGWGVDQMMLRIEEVLPITQPRAVVLSPLSWDILRNTYRRYGRAFKPWFEIDGDRLVLRGQPVLRTSAHWRDVGKPQSIFGYSYLVYWSFSRVGWLDWWADDGRLYDQVYENEVGVEVSCRLMERFKELATTHDFRPIFMMEYGAHEIMESAPPWFATPVLGCAAELGIETIDTFPALRAIGERGKEAFDSLWVLHRDREQPYGHPSAFGQSVVAALVREQLEAPMPGAAVTR